VKQLSGKLSEVNACVTPACKISQPLLLRTDIRSERDPVRRTNEEEHKDFAVAGLLWVDKSEGLDLTLIKICRAWVLVLIAVSLIQYIVNLLYSESFRGSDHR